MPYFSLLKSLEKLMCLSDSQVTLLLSCCGSLLKIHGYMIVVTWDRPITYKHSKKCGIKEASSEFSASYAKIFKILTQKCHQKQYTNVIILLPRQ